VSQYCDSAAGWTIEALWFDLEQVQVISLFYKVCWMALEPSQPPVQWVLGAVFSGVEQPADR